VEPETSSNQEPSSRAGVADCPCSCPLAAGAAGLEPTAPCSQLRARLSRPPFPAKGFLVGPCSWRFPSDGMRGSRAVCNCDDPCSCWIGSCADFNCEDARVGSRADFNWEDARIGSRADFNCEDAWDDICSGMRPVSPDRRPSTTLPGMRADLSWKEPCPELLPLDGCGPGSAVGCCCCQDCQVSLGC
jgi:hypothetical protein